MAPWPPDTATANDAVVRAAEARLVAAGIAEVLDVSARLEEHGWRLRVVTEPDGGSDVAIQEALSPAAVDVVSYRTSVVVVPARAPAMEWPDGCAFCGTTGAPWLYEVAAEQAPVALARWWAVCDTCHDLIEQHDQTALSARARQSHPLEGQDDSELIAAFMRLHANDPRHR